MPEELLDDQVTSDLDRELMQAVILFFQRTYRAIIKMHQEEAKTIKMVSEEDPLSGLEVTLKALERGMRSLPLEERLFLDIQRGERDYMLSRDFVLRLLGNEGTLTRGELERECEGMHTFDKDIFTKMQQNDLIIVSVDPNGNAENDMMTLTASGIATWKDVDQIRLSQAHQLFGGLSEEEKEQLLKLLRKLTPKLSAQAE